MRRGASRIVCTSPPARRMTRWRADGSKSSTRKSPRSSSSAAPTFGARLWASGVGREAAAGADQQRIAEGFAQARERPAHRRLAEAYVGAGMGDVAPPEQRLERRQKIKVESG